MAIQNHQLHTGQTSDQLVRTDWFGPDIDPTIPGDYECSTTGDSRGHIFIRRWDGTHWVSSVTFKPTVVRMHWRGVKPGSIEIGRYPSALRAALRGYDQNLTPFKDLIDPERARAAEALYDETMATP